MIPAAIENRNVVFAADQGSTRETRNRAPRVRRDVKPRQPAKPHAA